jgi:hypothetical protein
MPALLYDPPNNLAYFHDEHAQVLHEDAARRAIVDHHELPAWNPYFCGGIVEIANAPSNVLAPDFLLRILYGTVRGRKLAILFFVVFGMEGVFRLARKNGAGALGAAMGAIAWSVSGNFVTLLNSGWAFMFDYGLVPWIALSFENGLRRRWWIVGGGAFIAWLVLGGATYVLPFTALMLGMLVVYETVRARLRLDGEDSVRWYRPLATAAGMGAIAAGLAAIRLVPLVAFLGSHTRPVAQKDFASPAALFASIALTKAHTGWKEIAGDFYVGSFVVGLAVIAFFTLDRKAAKLWAIALVFAALACGEYATHAPYIYLHKLPLFSQLRFPVRMATMAGLFVAIAGGCGLTRIEDLLFRLSARITKSAIASGVATTALALAIGAYAARDVVIHDAVERGSLYTLAPPQTYDAPFRQSRGNRWDAHVWPAVSRGSLQCFEEHELFESPALSGDLAAEEYGAVGIAVERVAWSPHRIALHVRASLAGRVYVNQNHAPEWQSDVGTVVADSGRLAVDVPAGEYFVTLVYSDWKIRVGALVSFATALAIAIRAAKRGRSRVRAWLRWQRTLPP